MMVVLWHVSTNMVVNAGEISPWFPIGSFLSLGGGSGLSFTPPFICFLKSAGLVEIYASSMPRVGQTTCSSCCAGTDGANEWSSDCADNVKVGMKGFNCH